MKTVIHHLRRAALLQQGEGPSDSQLLDSFLSRHEDACFEALLRRHGPMVLAVCRRVLRNVHDAEDAFQATFLVLARKAGSLRSRELLANWLYGVAYRIALKARAMNAKRRVKEQHAAQTPRPEAPSAGADEILLAQLDHELNRLPEKYRVPLVLCELQGRSRKEAARQLELPEGTLSWRLAQAKKLLAKRLSRHGAALTVAAIAAAMTEAAARAGLSPALRTATLQTVLSAGAVPANVLVLTEGALKAMLLTKLKITVCAAVVALVAGVGASGLTYRATAEEPKQAEWHYTFTRSTDNRPQNDDLEALRLEIEALRKELRTTKERVTALEGEVRGSKESQKKDTGRARASTADVTLRVKPSVVYEAITEKPSGKGPVATVNPARNVTVTTVSPARKEAEIRVSPARKETEIRVSPARKETATQLKLRIVEEDPLGAAQEALKQLRKNPRDKEAAAALEKALKWLKEQDKPRWKLEKSEQNGGPAK